MSYFLMIGLLLTPELTVKARLVGKQGLGIWPSLYPQLLLLGYRHTHTHTPFPAFIWLLRMKWGTSHIYDKDFTQWATSYLLLSKILLPLSSCCLFKMYLHLDCIILAQDDLCVTVCVRTFSVCSIYRYAHGYEGLHVWRSETDIEGSSSAHHLIFLR